MPNWEGIEDVSSKPTRVWLTRKTDDDLWKPLRKCDCRALNENPGKEVLIDGGRATADPKNGVIRQNFYNTPPTQLTSATWFMKEEVSKKVILRPMSELDRSIVEDLYQRAITAASSLGSGIDAVLQEKYVLQDDADYHVMVVKVGSTLSMKKKHKGWFGKEWELQRGWGEYVVEGEEEEEMLAPVNHLIFVVHGIGEAMWSRDAKTYSIVEEVNRARRTLQKMQVVEWKKACETARKVGGPGPPPPNRIELLPIEWYDRIHSSSNALMTSLKATTLQSIPALRAIANDVIFDVLMYMTSTFCQSVLECVTEQISNSYGKFHKVHPDWGGKCSLIGHSLGSVIVWDLLSILKEHQQKEKGGQSSATQQQQPSYGMPDISSILCGVSISNSTNVASSSSAPHGYQAYATTDEHANTAENGYWGPSLPKPMKQCIPFEPEFTLFLGSPLGLFLTLRGAHAVFDEMRELVAATNKSLSSVRESQLTPSESNTIVEHGKTNKASATKDEEDDDESMDMVSPFTLPAGSIYNIFHPSDPVAYRIEPLLLPQDLTQVELPPPVYLVKQGQSVRFHVKAMQLSRSIAEKSNTWSSLVSQVTEQAVTALSNASLAAEAADGEAKKKRKLPRKVAAKFPLGGKSDRVDFQLQPGVIDNEYFSAVTAHSSYFVNTDILEFVLDLVTEKKTIETINLTAVEENATDAKSSRERSSSAGGALF